MRWLRGDAVVLFALYIFLGYVVYRVANSCYRRDDVGYEYPEMVVMIISQPTEREVRRYIRSTWISPNNSLSVASGRVQPVFLIGWSQHDVSDEAEEFGDILMVNVREDYRNLVYKIIAGMRAILRRFPQVQYVLKIDSDAVAMLDRLYQVLSLINVHDYRVVCNVIKDKVPTRNKTHKWFVPHTAYPRAVFPNYCAGASYLMTKGAVARIVSNVQRAPIFGLEDAYLTGVVAELAGVHPLYHAPEVFTIRQHSGCFHEGCIPPRCLGSGVVPTAILCRHATNKTLDENYQLLQQASCTLPPVKT